MTNFIRKIQAALGLLLIASAGPIYADWTNQPDCPSENNFYYTSLPLCNFKGFIIADLLYWRAFESGLDECIPATETDELTCDGNVISRFKGKNHDPRFKWDPGFRITAGYIFENWDVVFSWAHFNSHTSASNRQRLRWNLDYDVIDIIVGYETELSPCFTLRPFTGLRAAQIDQKIRMSGVRNAHFTSHRRNHEDFAGFGPILGLDTNWCIGGNFSFYANASVSWLYGNFDIKLIEDSEFSHAQNHYQVKKHLNAIVSVADAAFGLRWQTCIFSDFQLVLQLGLEHHSYFDYNRLGNYGDLSFDGVNFSAGIAF
ncbi:MAG: hypothetical protein H0V82_05780 [Candidatus Protochlamydia sp.]|nr:hypothetical protein [Candidatus Protochlamydia sp.]